MATSWTQSVRNTGSTANDGTENDDSNAWDDGSVLIGRLSGSLNNGFRFINVTIPAGATILTAVLTFMADADRSGNIATHIYGVKETDFAGFSSSNRPSVLTKTTASAQWNFSTAWVNGNTYDSADFASVVQEIIDQVGWASGNDIGILVMNDTGFGNDYRDAKDYNDNASPSFVTNITITYEVSSPSPSLSPSSSASASLSPSASPSLSISPSSSVSASLSPSASTSPSASLSPSASQSPSASPSLSLSPSGSSSASLSPSASISPSPSFPDWEDQSVTSATWENQNINSATWTDQTNSTTNWTNQDISRV